MESQVTTGVSKGDIRCGKTERAKFHPQIPGYEKINASSRGPRRWKGLSPFLLGPFRIVEPKVKLTYYPDGVHPGFTSLNEKEQTDVVQVFENYWQMSKIYAVDIINGVIQKSFFERRAKGFADPKGHRRALPKAKYGLPVSSYYQGQVMDYITSRKKIYCPTYEFLVTLTPEYADLLNLVNSGQNVLIVGPDGRDIPITYDSLKQAVNDPRYIFGHELVLCSLLKGWKVWED